MTTYYEREEYRMEERERKNGLTRESQENGEWSRGTPPYRSSRRDREPYTRQPLRSEQPPLLEKHPERESARRERDPYAPRYDAFERRDSRFEPVPSTPRPRQPSELRYSEPPVERDNDSFRRRSASVRRPPAARTTEEYREYKELRRSTDNLAALGRERDTREAPYFSLQGRRSGSRPDLYGGLNNDALSRPGSPGQVAGVGDIVNTEHGFTIQLDVHHFKPEEIKVVLTGDLLCVSGDRLEKAPGIGGQPQQTLRRSFSRKYCIPLDIKLESIQSHLTDNGFLVVTGARRGWKETQIMAHPPSYNEYANRPLDNYRSSGRNSVISHV